MIYNTKNPGLPGFLVLGECQVNALLKRPVSIARKQAFYYNLKDYEFTS
jgi:hypothetical protein